MRVLICGSRYWSDMIKVRERVQKLVEEYGTVEIIEGGARGADACAQEVAKELGLKVTTVKADWEKYGKSAGPIRNREMLDMLVGGDFVIAFHNNIKKSRGTIDTVFEANMRGIFVELIA